MQAVQPLLSKLTPRERYLRPPPSLTSPLLHPSNRGVSTISLGTPYQSLIYNVPSDAIVTVTNPHTNLDKDHTMRRRPVNKSKSAAQFRRNTSHTKAANVKTGPSRGGIRL
ncbi:MAG: hypothetical protein [Microvirus sp.]|nr:MAG: hypothetical protein [Microvirus sp.]